jgi:hypothetical protein
MLKEYGLNLGGSGQKPVARSCEHEHNEREGIYLFCERMLMSQERISSLDVVNCLLLRRRNQTRTIFVF